MGNGVLARARDKRRAQRETELLRSAESRAAEEHERVALLRAIEAGEAQPLDASDGLLLRNSEVLWHRCSATVLDRKEAAHAGQLFLTSLRMSFVSTTLPIDVALDAINAVQYDSGSLSVIAKTNNATQTFHIDDPELAAAHLRRCVKVYHRQVDVGFEGPSRHIPQDVKTAVWQRDGGKCVQCGAGDYLEFDHIIPHAKGGASTVENIQLLCRRCNLKKGASL